MDLGSSLASRFFINMIEQTESTDSTGKTEQLQEKDQCEVIQAEMERRKNRGNGILWSAVIIFFFLDKSINRGLSILSRGAYCSSVASGDMWLLSS